jgi:hypothetical protein
VTMDVVEVLLVKRTSSRDPSDSDVSGLVLFRHDGGLQIEERSFTLEDLAELWGRGLIL